MTGAVAEFIVRHIADRRGVSADEIDCQADMFETGYIDSLGVFSMIVLLEEEFGIRFSEQELIDPALYTVTGLASSIASKSANVNA